MKSLTPVMQANKMVGAPQVLTQSLARMKKYLSDETDLAPFREMILYQNANELFK